MTEIFLSQSSIMYFYLFIDDFCNKIPLRLTHIFNVRGHHCKYLHICKIYSSMSSVLFYSFNVKKIVTVYCNELVFCILCKLLS